MTRMRMLALAGGTTLALTLAACDGLREAFTAHVDVAAEVGSQELSVTRLAELVGNSRLPLEREVAEGVANIWVDYQLFAHAAAQADSLKAPGELEAGLWAEIAQARVAQFYEQVSRQWDAPPEVGEAQYNQGDVLAARHILLRVAPTAISNAERDSVRRLAESVRARITPQNFAALARQYGQDGTSEQGGYLGVFSRGDMVPEFEAAVLALQPGEISPVIQTQHGYHIVQRSPYSEVADDFGAAYAARYRQKAESTYLADLETAGEVEVRSNAAAVVRRVATDPDEHRDDRTVIATSTAGNLTASRLAQWVISYPPEAQLRQQLQQAPDSIIPLFVRNIARNELVLKQADSAGIAMSEEEMTTLRTAFANAVNQIWNALGLNPDSLAAAAATEQERERMAASQVDQFLTAVVSEQARYVPIPPPVQTVLRGKYSYQVVDAGIDRALERAGQIRASADSSRAATAPPSQVPMPTPQQPQQTQPPPPQP